MKLARLPNGSPEIFRTLQGEGVTAGCPAVFLRLSLCNLHCSWCDTPFTWNWKGTSWVHQNERKFAKEEHLIELNPSEIAHLLEMTAQDGDRLVITGGEPLLQQRELARLLTLVRHYFSAVEVETNGTQVPIREILPFISQFNVSPKLANSGNNLPLRIKKEALQFFAENDESFFKFVVTSPGDLAEVLSLQTKFKLPKKRILLMSEGCTPAALAQNRTHVVEACLEHGLRFCDRLHVQIWGDERGR